MQTSPSYIHNVLVEAESSPTQVPKGTFTKFQQFSSRWGKTSAKVSQGPLTSSSPHSAGNGQWYMQKKPM